MVLTHTEMLGRWMLHCGYEPLRADATVVRADGIDLERLMAQRMRRWYLDLLDTAPVELLETDDIAAQLQAARGADGCARLTLPDECRRLISIRMSGWARNATVVAADSPVARRQCNPMTRGGAAAPVAVVEGREVWLYSPAGSNLNIESAVVVMRPPADTYRLDERALSLIPEVEQITSHLP